MTNETNGGNPADDAALLEAVLSGPPPGETPEPDAPAVTAPETPEPETPAQAEKPAAPAPVPQQKPDNRVPLNELIEERKERQKLERQLAELNGRFQQFQQYATQQQAPQQVDPPDFLEDPAGFVAHQQQPFVSQFQQTMLGYAAELASIKYGEEQVKQAAQAFDEAERAGMLHPSDVQRVKNSRNPYAEAVNWYKQRTVLNETGGDLNAYLAKERERLLSDPEFRKQAMAAWNTQAQAAAPTTSRPVISLPSIAKVGAAALPGKSSDETGAELLANVLSRKRGSDGRFR